MLTVRIVPKTLHFKNPAGTSRGIYTTRQVYYIVVTDSNGNIGLGECAPLPKLSCDDIPNYTDILHDVCMRIEQHSKDFEEDIPFDSLVDYDALRQYPSILFGLETAFCHLKSNSIRFSDNPFTRGESGITINGLIWMGKFDEMKERIEEKISKGFHCIKIKIGAIDFEQEITLISQIRKHFGPEQIELRVDANGAFTPQESIGKLKRLSDYDIHSIEQPIRAGQWEAMAELCQTSPIPIALDEELIGINTKDLKQKLLSTVMPQYIILKPSLHGGLAGSDEWIGLAEKSGIKWWATSALESNVGLNMIAQWAYSKNPIMPQGLGTGMLYTDNIPFPLEIKGEKLWMNDSTWEMNL